MIRKVPEGAGEPARQRAELVQALLDGVRGGQVKDKMAELEARKRKLEAELEQGASSPIRLHPNMGERYRKQVTGLIDALNEPDRRTEATKLIRALIDRIVFSPERGNPKRVTLDLHGDLAGIPGLVSETGGKPPVTTMVAGARYQRYLPDLKCRVQRSKPFSRLAFDMAFEP
jgi:hypothetical protein